MILKVDNELLFLLKIIIKFNNIMAELNLIIGCMFSGKTTELLRIAKRLRSIEQKVILVNYFQDKRYSDTEMATHDKNSMPCVFVEDLMTLDYSEYSIICINEAQFFTNLKQFTIKALNNNKKLFVSGLDGDYKQNTFGEILELIPMCDSITRLHAYCKVCKDGTKAHFTKRINSSTEQKLIGTDEYIPVCRKHLN